METDTFPSSMGGNEGIVAGDGYVESRLGGGFELPEEVAYVGLGRRNGLRGALGSKTGEPLEYIPICGTEDGGEGGGTELVCIVDAVGGGEWAVPFKFAMGYAAGSGERSGGRNDDASVGGGNGLMIPGWAIGC